MPRINVIRHIQGRIIVFLHENSDDPLEYGDTAYEEEPSNARPILLLTVWSFEGKVNLER